jgi:quinol-cytochrome oxidoreductase complex cytochrome b subunit
MEENNIFKDPDWVLGDVAWFVLGGTIVIGLLMLNAYVQRIARSEEDERIARLASERLNQERLAASQSRRPDEI